MQTECPVESCAFIGGGSSTDHATCLSPNILFQRAYGESVCYGQLLCRTKQLPASKQGVQSACPAWHFDLRVDSRPLRAGLGLTSSVATAVLDCPRQSISICLT